MDIKRALGIAWVGLAWATPSYGLTVEEAYQTIPHQRTVFQSDGVQMDRTDAAYLEKLFSWVDQAIVAKVTAMKGQPVAEAYAGVWPAPKTLKPPVKLEAIHASVAKSIEHEYKYLKTRQSAGIKTFDAADPNVRSASGYAHQAYSQLMSAYPSENAHNKQAFFNYLCALDFL